MSDKKKETYYEVWSDHPGSWLLGKLVANRKQLDETARPGPVGRRQSVGRKSRLAPGGRTR
jgi:hypothetical protein